MEENKKKKKKGWRIAINVGSFVIGSAIIIGAGYYVLTKTGILGGNTNSTLPNTLTKVIDLSYSESDNKLTWSLVEHADQYEIKINDKALSNKVDTNSYIYSVVAKTTTFSVRALNSQYDYNPGSWSEVLTYNIENNDKLSVANVNIFANALMEDYQLENVVGIAINKENPKMLNVYANYTESGKSVLEEINVFYKDDITTLEAAINGYDNREKQTSSSFTNVTYDSANAYLEKEELGDVLQQYREDGYTFSVVTSQTAKTSTFSGNIFATIKASKGNETKYFVTNVSFDVFDASAIEKNNFTTKISDGDANLGENFCFECTGDFGDYAANVDKTITESKNDKVSVYNVNLFANSFWEGCELDNVVGIRINDEDPKILNIYANYAESGKSALHEIDIYYKDEITTLEGAIDEYSNRKDEIAQKFANANVTYDSANAFLEREVLDGVLNQHRENGYNLSVVTSQTVKDNYSSSRFGEFFATFKATKSEEVKYFVANYTLFVSTLSHDEKENFIDKVKNGSATVEEKFCFECTGDFGRYAANVDKAISESKN